MRSRSWIQRSPSVVSSGTLRIRVSHVVALSIDPDDVGVRLGRETAYRALATLADGATRVDVTDRVVWSSSDPKLLRVGDSARTKGALVRCAPAMRCSRSSSPSQRPRPSSR
jgi:hypothetical protein